MYNRRPMPNRKQCVGGSPQFSARGFRAPTNGAACPGAVLGAVLLLLSACAVGPDFKTPDLPAAASGADYTPAPMPARTAPGQRAGRPGPGIAAGPRHSRAVVDVRPLGAARPADPRLARAKSFTLASAQAALRQAEATYDAKSGNLL